MSSLFDRDTRALFWNNHRSAIQRMLDYDSLIGREIPSVAGVISPTGSLSGRSSSSARVRFWSQSIEHWRRRPAPIVTPRC